MDNLPINLLGQVHAGLQWRWQRVTKKLYRKLDFQWLWIVVRSIITGRCNLGVCSICERRTLFVEESSWLRDHYLCARCRSVPRWRALIEVLNNSFPEWRKGKILESSPGGPASDKLQRECFRYVPTHYFPGQLPGSHVGGVRCENLERLTFPEESFDLVITQDVFEHVLNPGKAFKEVARVLKRGGAHVFTVPYFHWQPTFVRALETAEGIQYLAEKQYHGNPIDAAGSLVVTDWGEELVDFIYQHGGLITSIFQLRDRSRGLDAEFLEVFVSKKRSLG